jgi:hypothetical protein
MPAGEHAAQNYKVFHFETAYLKVFVALMRATEGRSFALTAFIFD